MDSNVGEMSGMKDARHMIPVSYTHLGKADAGTQQKLMARMLQIMLIIGIIDDALQVAFIVAHLHGKFIDIIPVSYTHLR